MKGTIITTMVGVMLAVCASGAAHANEPGKRYDAKLERWMMDRAAERLGGIRGSLEQEWREPTLFDRFVAMDGRELSLMLHRVAAGPTTASVLQSEFSGRQPEVAAQPFIESPNRASRVIPLHAKADG